MVKEKIFQACEQKAEREFKEEPHPYRSNFEKDRDRILYSKEFRRLSGKTQVFVSGFDDRTRTRLTHTIEVSQIARTIAKNLGLNESLTEAIALAHDIGHTPFGHIGERTLNYIMNGCDIIKDFNLILPEERKGFKHNWQSLRVINDLEKIDKRFSGLNLTYYTMWGVLNHSKKEWKECKNNADGNCSLRHHHKQECKNSEILSLKFYTEKYKDIIKEDAWTFEGLVVKWADEIAQRHHDIEDGIIANIINKEELIEVFEQIFKEFFGVQEHDLIRRIKDESEKTYYISDFSKLLVNFLVTNLINNAKDNLEKIKTKYSLKSQNDFLRLKTTINTKDDIHELIKYENGLEEKDIKFQDYLCNRILNSSIAQSMDGKSNYLIRNLIKAYLTNPQQLPDQTIITLYYNLLSKSDWDKLNRRGFNGIVGDLRDKLKSDHYQNNQDEYRNMLLRTVCDYIAGMTDKFAVQQYELLYGAKFLNDKF